METTELEREVRNTLIENAELMAVLPNGANAIYHHVAPAVDPTRYPIIVYAPISDVPTLNGDNRELAHRVTIRIHVITSQRRFDTDERDFVTACRLVQATMASLRFFRQQTTPYVEDGKVMSVMDFVRKVKS